MSHPTGTLQAQLDEITAQVPDPIGTRIDAAIAQIDASGIAQVSNSTPLETGFALRKPRHRIEAAHAP